VTRVYVVGGPGSGKTSLAGALGGATGIRVVHLDEHWDRTFATDAAGAISPEAIEYRQQLVGEQLGQPDWIIEGAEPPLLTALASASDVIVWCDVSFRVAAFRMIRRHVMADVSGANAFPGYGRLWRFLKSVRRRYEGPADSGQGEWTKWTRAYVRHAIEPHRAKTLRSRGGNGNRTVAAVLGRVAREPGR
jgi:adenylate kinase family enzyme